MRYAVWAGAGLLLFAVLLWEAVPPPTNEGYLSAASLPDATKVLTPPTDDKPDRAFFTATRGLEGSARWTLAQNDNASDTPDLLKAFSCAANLPLDVEHAPALARIITRVHDDTEAVTRRAKNTFQRRRPFLLDKGAVCLSLSDQIKLSFDYPSGHTAIGWATGLILAELTPARAAAIMGRAKAYGESRLVCGVHSFSAVEAGRTVGDMVVAAVHGEGDFTRDMTLARLEIEQAALRAPPDAVACAAEADLIGQPLMKKDK